jgi:hypothetical protein
MNGPFDTDFYEAYINAVMLDQCRLFDNYGYFRNWPTAEIHSKPEKLSAAKHAEFASDRFATLCWARAIGRFR